MKSLILILAVVSTLFASCGEAHRLHVTKRTFTIADPQELYYEDPANPGTFVRTYDSLIVIQKRIFFGYDTGDKTIVKNKVTSQKK